jgi:hypothetical protein
MPQKFANAARGFLADGINNSTTTITISSGGSLFPVANTTDWFYAVLQDQAGIEIVRVNTHTAGSNSFTVVRGQGGTTARSFALGSVFGQRVTADDMDGALNLKANTATAVEQSDIGTAPNEIPLNGYLGDLAYMNRDQFVITPPASVDPNQIGGMTFQLTNNTTLVIKVKGSDGVVRSNTLTLA